MFARTERLLLRPAWEEDAPALRAAIGDCAIAHRLRPRTPADARTCIGAAARPLPRLLAFARASGAPCLIGGVGLDEAAEGVAELGFWVARPFRGLGYATEAGRAMADLARGTLRLQGLVAAPDPRDPGSAKVLHKLGFRRVADGRAAGEPAAGGRFALLFERARRRPLAEAA
jgi:RimJ/RimL family protein N-acetyltransferase